MKLPPRIATPRLLLRCWEPADAPALKTALDANLGHLRPWMPWVANEPSPLPVIEERLARFAADFEAGAEWLFAILTTDETIVLGGCGLHPRIGADGLEIGYWIDQAHCRRGYATEAAAALTEAAFARTDIERLEIRCDPRNIASAGVPGKLGYRHVRTLRHEPTADGERTETMIWELTRSEYLRP